MTGIALILVLGVSAQWVAWRLHVPSILILLLFGFLAGPVTHVLDPQTLLGNLLMPVVSLSVALVLFEGGMSLRLGELREVGAVVRNLVTVGALTTGVVTAVASRWAVGLSWHLAALLGAILSVTGPTVIGPLLRHVRPMGRLGPILKWEGIVIDPLGALAAVLVFESFELGKSEHPAALLIGAALKTAGVGCATGILSASALVVLFRRRWVPDHLHNPLTLMAVAAAFVSSNAAQHESGLFAVTVMGLALANQRWVVVHHIAEFKETLSILLISSLFIILAARLELSALVAVGWRGLLLLAALIFIARPACVAVSTLGSGLSRRQRLFLAAMAPRGIVAASVASVFALRLREAGVPGAQLLVPLTFIVIVGTVLVYGLTAAPLGWWLGVAWPNAQGCLIVGAHALGRAIGLALQEEGVPVLLLDTNRGNIQQARLDGLPTLPGSVVSRDVHERVELSGIGRLLALTPNDEVNSLATLSFTRTFGRSEVYQLAQSAAKPLAAGIVPTSGNAVRRREGVSPELVGRRLFGPGSTYAELARRLEAGAIVKRTPLTAEFGLEQFQSHYRNRAVPLFLMSPTGELTVLTDENAVSAAPGKVLVSLVEPSETLAETGDGRDVGNVRAESVS
jgi:NhaP-type Na+/H+ or K+/H+ antiporter